MNRKSRQMTDREIREHLGHNVFECRVRITRCGIVDRYGSPDPADRGLDYWHNMGRREEYRITDDGEVVRR